MALSEDSSEADETEEWDSITALEISTIIESDLHLELTAEQSLSLVSINSVKNLLGG
jgi:acyl carrier protein